ncbi:hypothetical protein MAPG_10189 [Magnaporthiopsis poae ATCC 64411]|uniref:Uncharacterized protein n=1 Tax=Magnaporthiopsis poae (strain ATCC 64411 / 73-15) TaxID=644358 RepID=A0A0C4EBX7_MAGP6|nr:hypothetical protein MAPG_10189 [Magnaporthiopsis poae ATCC 64411]
MFKCGGQPTPRADGAADDRTLAYGRYIRHGGAVEVYWRLAQTQGEVAVCTSHLEDAIAAEAANSSQSPADLVRILADQFSGGAEFSQAAHTLAGDTARPPSGLICSPRPDSKAPRTDMAGPLTHLPQPRISVTQAPTGEHDVGLCWALPTASHLSLGFAALVSGLLLSEARGASRAQVLNWP